MEHINRRLLPDTDTLGRTPLFSPDPLLQAQAQPINTSTKSRPFRPNSPIDSSMALTALVLLTALFFMGFFSLYLRRFADSSSRRRSPPPLPYSSSSSSSYSLPVWRYSTNNYSRGLDPSTVRSLPLVSYGGDAKHPIDCVICLCEYADGETVKMIPGCRHVFHPDCIDAWLVSHASCPLCRSSRIFGGGEVCLGVVQGEVDRGGGEGLERESTVEIIEEEEEEEIQVGTVGIVRRACSYPSLGDRVVLERCLSF